MKIIKNKFFTPIILIGFLAGYLISNNFFSRTMPIQEQADIIEFDLLTALGANPNYYRQTNSGSYLAGQFAQRQKDWDTAYQYISKVETDSTNLELQRHLMVLAMAKGDLEKAKSIADQIAISESEDSLLSTLFLTVDAFKSENYQSAINNLNNLKDEGPATFLVPILKLWAQAGLGDIQTINLPPSSFYAHHALLIHHYVKPSPALLNYALQSYKIEEIDLRDVIKFADLLVLTGQERIALDFYRVVDAGGFATDQTREKIQKLKNKEDISFLIDKPVIKSAKQGAAYVFEDMANILIRENSDDSAVIFARMALALHPKLDQNKMIIGAVLSTHDQDAQAIKVYNTIPETSKKYILAQRSIADIHTNAENYDDAISILTKLYEDGDIDSLVQIGDVYRYQEKFEESVKTYSKVLNHWDEVPANYWHVYYSRGMAYERLKEYKKSESDLLVALQFQPNHPYVLNYLAYSWADQGINLDKSLSMLMMATQLKPEDGYIADSLGWVFYKMNDFENAIPHLERAVELLPYDATLNDHLGDAYWQTGRKNEAKFQWERAANYAESNQADLKSKVQDKLANGIDKLKPANDNAFSKAYSKDNGV